AVRALEQVRHVPEFSRLLLKCGDQRGVRVAERVDCDTRGEIEVAIAIGGGEPTALTARKTEIDPGEYGKQMRRGACGHGDHLWVVVTTRALALRIDAPRSKIKRPPFQGGAFHHCMRAKVAVNAAQQRFCHACPVRTIPVRWKKR